MNWSDAGPEHMRALVYWTNKVFSADPHRVDVINLLRQRQKADIPFTGDQMKPLITVMKRAAYEGRNATPPEPSQGGWKLPLTRGRMILDDGRELRIKTKRLKNTRYWKDWTFVYLIDDGIWAYLGRQGPGGTYEGSMHALLRPILTDPIPYLERASRTYGICGYCLNKLGRSAAHALRSGRAEAVPLHSRCRAEVVRLTASQTGHGSEPDRE